MNRPEPREFFSEMARALEARGDLDGVERMSRLEPTNFASSQQDETTWLVIETPYSVN